MKYRYLLFLVLSMLIQTGLAGQSFRKGFKQYNRKHNYPAATTIFRKHLQDKYAAGSRLFLARIAEHTISHPDSLLALDSMLRESSGRLASLPHRKAARQARKFGINNGAILELRRRIQIRAIDLVRARNTIPALDSLLAIMKAPLPEVAPYLDSNRIWIVNGLLDNWDYDDVTSILNNHLKYVSPEHYALSRSLPDRSFKLFQQRYSLCRLDKFFHDHPLSYISRDCWHEEARMLFCKSKVAELLDFHARVSWSALEFILINHVLNLVKTETTEHLTPAQKQQLEDMRRIYPMYGMLQKGTRDTAEVRSIVENYITRNAPRYSAFSLLEKTVQYYLERRAYGKAVSFLKSMQPYFPDQLPADCKTNFDFQVHAGSYIRGLIPILEQPEVHLSAHPLASINTEDGDEFSPVLTRNGDTLYFAGAGRPDNIAGQDVFMSVRKQDSTWSAPVVVAALSGPGNQVPLSLTAGSDRFLLLINGRLHIARKSKPGGWEKPVRLILEGISATGRAVFAADGKTIVLEGSDSGGTALQGPDMDLFITTQDAQGHWSAPAGLGANVNTEKQEGNPFLMPDGKTLYFTSSGYPGLGRSDVFVTTRTGSDWAHWTRAVNLGKEINDTYPHRGFGFVSGDAGRAVYAVYPEDGGKWDIWETELPRLLVPKE